MKAKMAIQQKMYRDNSWGNGKQSLKELLTFFDRFVANGSCKIVLDQYGIAHGSKGWSFWMDSPEPFERMAWAVWLSVRQRQTHVQNIVRKIWKHKQGKYLQ